MKFRSKIAWPTGTETILHTDGILSMGSCFAQRIGQRMAGLKWNILTNPTGIIYNPVSLCKHLDHIREGHFLKHEDLVCHQGIYHHFDFHSKFSSTSPDETIQQINSALESANKFKTGTKWLFLTLGTAWVFKRNVDNSIVANCHKFPSSEFTQELLSVQEISRQLKVILRQLQQENHGLKIILTVSPVRHLRHGMANNNRSKSTLVLAVHEVAEALDDVFYFPSYEIMMDDLRDYRFYEQDLIHPNQLAIDYIWDIFCDTMMSASTRLLVDQIQNLKQRVEHRAFVPHSEGHQAFIKSTIKEIENFGEKHSHTSWEEELKTLRSHLK